LVVFRLFKYQALRKNGCIAPRNLNLNTRWVNWSASRHGLCILDKTAACISTGQVTRWAL